MHLLMKYFSHFDGTKKWEEIQPIVDATFHDDLIVTDGTSKYNKEEFTKRLEEFVNAGGWMEIIKLKVAPHKQGIRYEVVFHHPEDVTTPTLRTESLGRFSPENGKLISVQRDNTRLSHQIL